MSTTIIEPVAPGATGGPPPERLLRNLSIAANLLPAEIVQTRRSRQARRSVISALVVFVVLLSAWYGATAYQTAAARTELSSVEGDVQRLTQNQNKFKDLVGVQAESRGINSQLRAVLATDLPMPALVGDVQNAAPSGIRVNTISVLLTSSHGNTPTLPTLTKDRIVGTLSVAGAGRDKATVAAYVDALSEIPGLANAVLGSANLQNGQVDFTVHLDITSCRLGGRYTKAGKCETAGVTK